MLNGSSGMGVGFSTNILNRHPVDLIDACLAVLAGKKCPEVRPWINGFFGEFRRVPESPKSWTIHGKYEVKNTTTVEVTELPPSITYEKYEAHLSNLEEKGVIVSYEDHSATTPRYVIKFVRQKLQELIDKGRLEYDLKINDRKGENYTTLDESENLKVFQSPEEIVNYFVNFRLGYYELRKKKLLEKLAEDIRILDNRARFIKAIIDNKLKVNNRKKQEIEADLPALKIEKLEDSYSYLLQMPIYSLTKEKFDDLLEQAENKKNESAKITATAPKDMYVTDLKELRSKLSK